MSFSEETLNWVEGKLKDNVYIKGRIGWKGLKKSEFTNSGDYYIVNGPDIKDDRVSWDNCKYVSKERYDESVEIQLKENDILLTKDGTVGKMAFIDKLPKPATVASGIFVIRNNNGVFETLFIYYFLKSPDFRNLVSSRIEGSVIPHLYQRDLVELNIPIPPLEEQKAIAATLSCLDDKIELNNRINKNLEKMAQAIFKSWFVDFEPFQDGEFEDSELGRIPKGWRVGALEDIIELFDSKRIPLSSRKRETMQKTYPYYGATSLMDYVDDYIFDGIYVLLGEDGSVIDSKGYPILQYVWGKFWVNNHAHVLKGKNSFNEDSIYMLLKNTNVQGIVTGAVQLKINQANLKSLKVIIPPHDHVSNFNHILESLFVGKRRVLEENQTLTALRDTLLPKLMSGEIRVPIEEG